MKVDCPSCKTQFDWRPPDDTVVYEIVSMPSCEENAPERYVVTCPKCKNVISVYL